MVKLSHFEKWLLIVAFAILFINLIIVCFEGPADLVH